MNITRTTLALGSVIGTLGYTLWSLDRSQVALTTAQAQNSAYLKIAIGEIKTAIEAKDNNTKMQLQEIKTIIEAKHSEVKQSLQNLDSKIVSYFYIK